MTTINLRPRINLLARFALTLLLGLCWSSCSEDATAPFQTTDAGLDSLSADMDTATETETDSVTATAPNDDTLGSDPDSSTEDTSETQETNSPVESDSPSQSASQLDTDTSPCVPPSLPLVSASLPCGAVGTVVITGVVDGVCLSETYEQHGHSFNQWIQPYSFDVSFGQSSEDGLLQATWTQDILHDSEAAVNASLTLPLSSALSGLVLEGGEQTVLKTPQMLDDDFRLVLRHLSSPGTIAPIQGEVGVCVML